MVLKKGFETADRLKEFQRLKLGSPEIDTILNGGFRTNILNEIVGCSGSGKTQICLVLSLMVQLPRELGGLNKAAVYICTDGVFPVKRLYELSYWFQLKYGMKNCLDNVFISHIPDYERLKKTLCIHLRNLVRFKDVGLIVIDTIAGVFRSDNFDVSYTNRSKQLTELAIQLRELGSRLNTVVVCCNQVTDDLKTGKSVPCLGLSWSNLLNSRFSLNRCYPSPDRAFQIEFAPDLANSKCKFSINETGLVGDKDK